MKPRTKAIVAGLFVLFLFWSWPNFIHEPLHVAAMKLQGGQANINFDLLSYPPHPSTTRTTEIGSIWGGLLFLLLPSLVSVFLLIVLVSARDKTLLLNISLPIYLTTDLFINVLGYRSVTSDFRFLVLAPQLATIIAGIIAICGLVVILKGVRIEVKKNEIIAGEQW